MSKHKPCVFRFDRYVNGALMAEGVVIEAAESVAEATRKAASIASRGQHGEIPVLVLTGSEPSLFGPADPLRSEAATRKDAEATAPIQPVANNAGMTGIGFDPRTNEPYPVWSAPMPDPAIAELVERLVTFIPDTFEYDAESNGYYDSHLTFAIRDAIAALTASNDRAAELKQMSDAHREHAQSAVEHSAALNRLLAIAEARAEAAEAKIAEQAEAGATWNDDMRSAPKMTPVLVRLGKRAVGQRDGMHGAVQVAANRGRGWISIPGMWSCNPIAWCRIPADRAALAEIRSGK